MRLVIQRVSKASVEVDGVVVGSIGMGLLVLIGFEENDGANEIEYASRKIVNMRIFDDTNGIMNLSVKEINGEILLISQFTLMAQTKKGNRPSYIKAAKNEAAISLYEDQIVSLQNLLEKKVERGVFGADMKVELINSGPVTIIVDTNESIKC